MSILLTLNSFGEENQIPDKTIDVETAVQSALQIHLSVQQSKIQLEQAKRKYAHSWNNFLPSLSANVSGAANGALTSPAENSLTFSTGINASLNINLGVGKKIAALKAAYESGQKDYEDAVREIETAIRKSFYSLLYLQGQVEISRASGNANESQYNQTKIKKEQGLVTELDLLTSQVHYESAKITLRNTEKAYFTATFKFLNEIGITVEPGQRVSFKGSLDDYVNTNDFELSQGNLDELIENSPAIRTIRNTLTKNKISRSQLALSAYLPTIILSANINPYSYHNAYSNAELQYKNQQLSLINSRLALKSLIGK